MEVRTTFNLRWDGFEANTRATLMELRDEAEFHDVTLVATGGSQVKANKMVLAGGSKFFHKILRENPHPHPLIYLKDVAYKQLLSVMDYLYTGQANIQEEDIKEFLHTAEDLEIKGLVPPDKQTKWLSETAAPLHNQPSAEEHAREKRKTYSPNAIPVTHQSHPAAQEQVASKSVMSSQSHVSTEENYQEKKKTYPSNMIPATHKDQTDIQGQGVSSKTEKLTQNHMFTEKQVESKHEYTRRATNQDPVVAGGKSSWVNVSFSQCQASADEHAQAQTRSFHKATPAVSHISTDVRISETRQQLPHNVSPPQIDNTFQNSNNRKVKVEVPVGDANDYNVHYEINDQGQHYISRFSKRSVPNNEKRLKYSSEQNEAMEQDYDDQIMTMVPKAEPIDSSGTTFHTEAVENEEVSNNWYEDEQVSEEEYDACYKETDEQNNMNLESTHSIKKCRINLAKVNIKLDDEACMKVQDEGVKYACQNCTYETKYKGDLKKHMQGEHEGVKYSCTKCSYEAKYKSVFRKHMLAKHGPESYVCQKCTFQTKYQPHLRIHMKVEHEGERYFCQKCSYEAKFKTALTMHMLAKHGDESFVCQKCDFQAKYKSLLRRHMKAEHEGERYFCQKCDFQSKYKSNLMAHMKAKHEGVTKLQL